jgi:hypothetical protein
MSYEQVMSDRLKRALIAEGGNLQYIDDDLKEYYHQSKRKFLGEVSPVQQRSAPTSQPQPEPPPFTLADADEFLAREIPPRQALLTDAETGSTVLYEKSLNQIFAYRGIGKSVVANSLIKVLTQGGEFLRFRSDGGLKTVLVDGELPAVQLQERLKEFSGTPKGLLKILSPELLTNPKAFPVLSVPAQQAAFIRQIEEFGPRVLIFDTLTRCFKFDTNDPDAWLVVNDFLLELRFRGYCVVLIHHAGKNGTQRGRTDGDDNLDISVILSPRYGWQPGDGLEFKWTYEKVRHGGHLPDFEAEYHGEGRWQLVQDDRTADVIALAKKGKPRTSHSRRSIGSSGKLTSKVSST